MVSEEKWLVHMNEVKDRGLECVDEGRYKRWYEKTQKHELVTGLIFGLVLTSLGLLFGYAIGHQEGVRSVLWMIVEYPEVFEGIKTAALALGGA